MQILLISPCIDSGAKTADGLMIPQLSLYILEGLTPDEHQVKIIEEESKLINLDEECDLVGISCMTANAPRAYYLAREFKKRGKTVVLGGVHPSLLPQEALAHADCVVKGEAEGVWEQLLEDFGKGELKRTYYNPNPPLDRYIPMNFKHTRKKRLFDVVPLMTTRGCPYTCEFCCVHDLYGKKVRHAPVSKVVRDIENSQGKTFIFLDDNIIGNPKYAKELFRAIKPLKIKWVGQASISFVKNTELMKLASESGCKALFFGLESVSENQLKKLGKSIKQISGVKEAIKKVKDLGILFHASFIFGFDDDRKDIFAETLDFLNEEKIGTASFNILTPYPGTKVYEQFNREGRLLTADWKYYDHSTVVFRPRHMSPYELQTGEMWVKKEFSKMSSIFKRFSGNLSYPLLYFSINRGIRKNVKTDMARLTTLQSKVFELENNPVCYLGENILRAPVINF